MTTSSALSSPVGPALVRAVMADDHALVWLSGEFDLNAEEQLTSIADELESARLPAVIDVTEVEFADSSLVNFLARLARQGTVVLCNPTTMLWDLVVLSGLGPLVSAVHAPGSPRT